MKYRVFDDYLGRRREVLQTNPSDSDRRASQRHEVPDRRAATRAESAERRIERDRRVQAMGRFPGIPPLEAGLLCFEREGKAERKRLAPVPEAWESADDMALAALYNFVSEESAAGELRPTLSHYRQITVG